MARMITYSFLLVTNHDLEQLAHGTVPAKLRVRAAGLGEELGRKLRRNAKRRLARGVATAPPDARHP